MLDAIQSSWAWIGLEAEEVLGQNDFGNLLIRDRNGRFWRICPEELSCEVVAEAQEELAELSRDPAFVEDWQMDNLVNAAQVALGPLVEGRSYCLKIPAVLGGQYLPENYAIVPTEELISFAGSAAKQIKDLPDGTSVEFRIVD